MATAPARPSSSRAPLTHPGPVHAERVVKVPTLVSEYEVALPAGLTLLAAVEFILDSTGCASATGQLIGGELSQFNYYVPAVGPAGGPVATFSAPRPGLAPGRMIRGGITIGRRDGAAWCHSHSLFEGADGVRRAGHLIPEQVVLGDGVRAHVWGFADVELDSLPDDETGMTLFTPKKLATQANGATPALACRLRPNLDFLATLEQLTADAGWSGAEVRGQVGSLVGGCLEQPDGSRVVVDGPATEVMFLEGNVRTVEGRLTADLSAHLVDRHGQVHSGRLVEGENLVALTYELVIAQS